MSVRPHGTLGHRWKEDWYLNIFGKNP